MESKLSPITNEDRKLIQAFLIDMGIDPDSGWDDIEVSAFAKYYLESFRSRVLAELEGMKIKEVSPIFAELDLDKGWDIAIDQAIERVEKLK